MALKEIGREIQALQKKWGDWEARTLKFCTQPTFNFPKDGMNSVAFLHFTGVLIERVRFVQVLMIQGIENYNKRYNEHENRKNFMIAISAWILTFLGLVASLAGLISQW
jgi:hypothetical protein